MLQKTLLLGRACWVEATTNVFFVFAKARGDTSISSVLLLSLFFTLASKTPGEMAQRVQPFLRDVGLSDAPSRLVLAEGDAASWREGILEFAKSAGVACAYDILQKTVAHHVRIAMRTMVQLERLALCLFVAAGDNGVLASVPLQSRPR